MHHAWLDQRSLAMHHLIAAKIRGNPALFDIAVQNVRRWQTAQRGPLPHYLVEWQRILELGLEPALQMALADGEEATRLRQSTPFADILTPQERWGFLQQWKDNTSNI